MDENLSCILVNENLFVIFFVFICIVFIFLWVESVYCGILFLVSGWVINVLVRLLLVWVNNGNLLFLWIFSCFIIICCSVFLGSKLDNIGGNFCLLICVLFR